MWPLVVFQRKKVKEKLFSITKKDFLVQTFRVGGNGGQHRDKTSSGVRVIHRATGTTREATDSRSQADNKRKAFLKVVNAPTFQAYLRNRAGQIQLLESELTEDKLLIEYRQEGRWQVQ